MYFTTVDFPFQNARLLARDNVKMRKECLITIGATAKFPELISAALSPEALQKFEDNGFTHIIVQYGVSGELYKSLIAAPPAYLEITGFGFSGSGLHNQIVRCQARPGDAHQGLVICHAGR